VVEKCEADEHGVEQARRLIANGVDGIILPPPLCDTRQLIDLIAASGTPAVTVACGQPDQRVSGVSIDDYLAAYAMTCHLISLGHQRIGFVIGHPNQSASARRLAGFQAAIAEKHARRRRSWSCRACSPTAPAWTRPKRCWRWSSARPPSSPATTTWPAAVRADRAPARPGRAGRPDRGRLR
jgi:DNA-binding LacI/PurR family transcriptional regulator